MEQKKKKEEDVLVVRDEKTGEISVVAGLDGKGYPKRIPPKAEHSQEFLRFDRHGDAIDNFFRNFYRQCKEPTRFGFYRVAADMVEALLPVIKDLLRDPAANAELLAPHKVDTSAYQQAEEQQAAEEVKKENAETETEEQQAAEEVKKENTETEAEEQQAAEEAKRENTEEDNVEQQTNEKMEEMKQENQEQHMPSYFLGTFTEYPYLNVTFLFIRKLTPPYTNNPKNWARYSLQFNPSTKPMRKRNCAQ